MSTAGYQQQRPAVMPACPLAWQLDRVPFLNEPPVIRNTILFIGKHDIFRSLRVRGVAPGHMALCLDC